MTLLEYVNRHVNGKIFESINQSKLKRALDDISSILRKRNIYSTSSPISLNSTNYSNTDSFGTYSWTDKNEGAMLVWGPDPLDHNNFTVISILFTKDFDKAMSSIIFQEPYTWDVKVNTGGASIVKITQLILNVLNGTVAMTTNGINAYLADAKIFESINEAIADDPKLKTLQTQKQRIYMKLRNHKKRGTDTPELQKEYDDICKAYDQAKADVTANVTIDAPSDDTVESGESMFQDEMKATPEERFDDMKSYIYNVATGLKPLALLCGAPGVGKTYRVLQIIKGMGKVRGQDYELLKGKCTPPALYQTFYEYQKDGQLVILDDCDSVFRDEDAINLIKAATDSSDERVVAWNVSRPPKVQPELGEMLGIVPDEKGNYFLPKNFVFNGSVIIITNLSAGQIDTAIRNRALICDLNFTTSEILDIVRNIAPHIMPGKLSQESKSKALAYLEKMAASKAPMEISIRSFTTCAMMYESNASERAIQRRINEQMRLASLRGGKHY